MKHPKRIHLLFLLTALTLAPACRSEAGDTCTLSSDCPGTQICHPSERVCIDLTCEGISCFADIGTSPATDEGASSEADTNETKGCETEEKPGWRVSVFEVLEKGEGRQGIDVDKDPDTCWPTPCEDGFDNGFEKVSMFNSVFEESITTGDVALAFLQREADLEIYDVMGALDSGKAQVLATSLDSETGEPISNSPILSAKDGELSAEGGFMLLKLLVAGVPLLLPVEALSVKGILDENKMDVLIGGAITKKKLEEAVFNVPKEDLPDVIPDNEQLWTTIKILYKIDVDMDEDDSPESISINLRFQGTPATLCMP